jgi:hypothetical protein
MFLVSARGGFACAQNWDGENGEPKLEAMEMNFSEESPMGIFSCEIFLARLFHLLLLQNSICAICSLDKRRKGKGKMENGKWKRTK